MLCLLRLLKKNLFKKLRINKIYIPDNIIEQIHIIKITTCQNIFSRIDSYCFSKCKCSNHKQ